MVSIFLSSSAASARNGLSGSRPLAAVAYRWGFSCILPCSSFPPAGAYTSCFLRSFLSTAKSLHDKPYRLAPTNHILSPWLPTVGRKQVLLDQPCDAFRHMIFMVSRSSALRSISYVLEAHPTFPHPT